MRERLAKWMAILTGVLVCIIVVLFSLVQNQAVRGDKGTEGGSAAYPGGPLRGSSEWTPDEMETALGKVVYDHLRCRMCHSIAGDSDRGYPLDGVGRRLTGQEIRQWILAPGEIDPSIEKPDYNFLSPDQIDYLVKYIQSLP